MTNAEDIYEDLEAPEAEADLEEALSRSETDFDEAPEHIELPETEADRHVDIATDASGAVNSDIESVYELPEADADY